MVGMSGAYGGHHGNGGEGRAAPKQAVVVGAPPPPAAAEMEMEIGVVHKVAAQPAQSTASKMKGKVKETFFPDDPFRSFKGQPVRAQWVLAAKYLFPVLEWVPGYSLSLFKSDLVAGLTIASLAIPQGISYAKLANLPPIIGLYSSFVPPLVYAVLGSSRDLAVGPVSIASLIMGSMLRQAVSPSASPALFLQLAFTSTFFAGLVQASLGILRLGFIIDFLSKATLVGFMAGAAIIVSLQQLKALLGIVHFTTQMGIVPVMASVFQHTNEWSWQTILMGACFLVLLLAARHVVRYVTYPFFFLSFSACCRGPLTGADYIWPACWPAREKHQNAAVSALLEDTFIFSSSRCPCASTRRSCI